jgi:hypothetical protein
MTSSFARLIAIVAMVAALLLVANDGYGLPGWLTSALMGLAAALAVNMTVAAARLDRQEREARRTKARP